MVYLLEVGEGDSTLMAGPDFTILVDAGCHDRSDVVAHLREAGVTSIDLLVGTHPHAYHIGNYRVYGVRKVWPTPAP